MVEAQICYMYLYGRMYIASIVLQALIIVQMLNI